LAILKLIQPILPTLTQQNQTHGIQTNNRNYQATLLLVLLLLCSCLKRVHLRPGNLLAVSLGVYRRHLIANESFTIPNSKYGCLLYLADTNTGNAVIVPCKYYLIFDITENHFNIKRTTAEQDVILTAENGGWVICISVQV